MSGGDKESLVIVSERYTRSKSENIKWWTIERI